MADDNKEKQRQVAALIKKIVAFYGPEEMVLKAGKFDALRSRPARQIRGCRGTQKIHLVRSRRWFLPELLEELQELLAERWPSEPWKNPSTGKWLKLKDIREYIQD